MRTLHPVRGATLATAIAWTTAAGGTPTPISDPPPSPPDTSVATFVPDGDAGPLTVAGQDVRTDPTLPVDGGWLEAHAGERVFWLDPQPGQTVTWGPNPCSALNLRGERVQPLRFTVHLEGAAPAVLITSHASEPLPLRPGPNGPFVEPPSALCTSPIGVTVLPKAPDEDPAAPSAPPRCTVHLAPVGGTPARLRCHGDGRVEVE